MELVFSPKHFHHLACRHDGEELLVIILLYLAYLQINIVHPTYRTLAGVIIIGIDIAQLAHFVEERALFALHLPVQREEARGLSLRQPSLLCDKTLQIVLEPFGIKRFLPVLCHDTQGHDSHDTH